MVHMAFVHLHTHSHYTLLKWLPKPKEYIFKAKEYGMPWVALTDTNNIHGYYELYKYGKAEGITPIAGVELQIQSSKTHLLHTIVLLAINTTGYKNLLELISLAHIHHSFEKETPYITWNQVSEYREGLVCLSGNISWELAHTILSGKEKKEILEVIHKYQSLFQENYYVELLYHDDIPKQNFVTDTLIELYQQYHFPIVACQECFYIEKEEKDIQDIIQALGTGYEIKTPNRPTLIHGDYSFLSTSEMEQLFWFIPESLENTYKICKQTHIEIQTGKMLIPMFHIQENEKNLYHAYLEKQHQYFEETESFWVAWENEWLLRYLAYTWLQKKFSLHLDQDALFLLISKKAIPFQKQHLWEISIDTLKNLAFSSIPKKKLTLLQTFPKNIYERILRLEYELFVIHEMNFDEYFLIVIDCIEYARKKNIWVWPWRGSVGGSFMAYVCGITAIDPMDYDLLFERFLNPARISMPDIDIDFSDDERDKLIEYCANKYGKNHVARICTFWTLAARGAVKDVGRVLGIPFSEMNEFSKCIPEKPGTTLSEALEESPELQAYYKEEKYKKIIDIAMKIEGNVRQIGVHACAIVIAPEKLTNYTALCHPTKDKYTIITQYPGNIIEEIGLLKMDFLGLRTLTIIQKTQEIIANMHHLHIDMNAIPLNDKKVFDLFSAWDTTGIFQFESDWMRKYLIEMQPNTFEDLVAMVALYRPWPLAYIPVYIRRKHKKESVEYFPEKLKMILEKKYSQETIEEEKRKLEEDLRSILDKTYGIAIYQEQLMFIVQKMAGFSMAEADLLRRWIGKKKIEIIEKLKNEFIERAYTYKHYLPETSTFVYEEMIEPAWNYSFNKSHAVCYAYIAYQTAYLKAHFLTEFFTALMISDEENTDRINLEMSECHIKGIKVLPPDINESKKHFTYINSNTIRFWLKAIKGIGEATIEAIERERKTSPYKDISDLLSRVGANIINKKALEALILSWACDSFWKRWVLYHTIEHILQCYRKKQKSEQKQQISLFIKSNEEEIYPKDGSIADFSYEEKLQKEYKTLGFFISWHPLNGLKTWLRKKTKGREYLQKNYEEYKELFERTSWEKQYFEVVACGYIQSMKKTYTKTKEILYQLFVESFEYDFETLFYQKDYEPYKEMLHNRICFLEIKGSLKVDIEFKRKTIFPKEYTLFPLEELRSHAQKQNLLFEQEIYEPSLKYWWKNSQYTNTPLSPTKEMQETQEYAIAWKHTTPSSYTIHIPKIFKKEYLQELKEILTKSKQWNTHILLNFNGKIIDTHFSLASLETVQEWEKKYLS